MVRTKVKVTIISNYHNIVIIWFLNSYTLITCLGLTGFPLVFLEHFAMLIEKTKITVLRHIVTCNTWRVNTMFNLKSESLMTSDLEA